MRRNAERLAFYGIPDGLAGEADELLGAFEIGLDFAEPFELHAEHVRRRRRTAAENGAGWRQRLLRQTFQQAANRPTQRGAQLPAGLLRGMTYHAAEQPIKLGLAADVE